MQISPIWRTASFSPRPPQLSDCHAPLPATSVPHRRIQAQAVRKAPAEAPPSPSSPSTSTPPQAAPPSGTNGAGAGSLSSSTGPAVVVTPHWDVEGAVVNPVYRSTPWEAERQAAAATAGAPRTKARILLVGECNVCRSVLALAAMNHMLEEAGLQDSVECEAKGTRKYTLGQAPEASTQAAAQAMGWALPPGLTARQFDEDEDIVRFDLILVMDKYTAADVLREVSGYDLINPNGHYSVKVRLLGSFHPALTSNPSPGAQDIDDPLYGNYGGEEEQQAVFASAQVIGQACRGLVAWLGEIRDAQEQQEQQQQQQQLQQEGDPAAEAGQTESRKEAAGSGMGWGIGGSGEACKVAGFALRLRDKVRSMDRIQWLVPPMMSPRK